MTDSRDVERVLRQADDELGRDLAARTDVEAALARVKRVAAARAWLAGVRRGVLPIGPSVGIFGGYWPR